MSDEPKKPTPPQAAPRDGKAPAPKPQFKVTRSPFGPTPAKIKLEEDEGEKAEAPKPEAAEAPAAKEDAPAAETPATNESAPEAAPAPAAAAPKPAAPKPAAPKAAAPRPAPAKPRPSKPLPKAPVQVEEDSGPGILMVAVDAVCAAVAIAAAVMIFLGLKG